MKNGRRGFIKNGVFGLSPIILPSLNQKAESVQSIYEKLDEVVARPVLKTNQFPDPIIIDKLELLTFKGNFLCRVRTKFGAEGLSFGNSQLESLFPIFTKRLQAFFIGKDARDLEKLIEDAYRFKSNYKLQSVALWVPLATIEFAILDLLGKIANKSIGELIGKIHNKKIELYQANSKRGISAEETMDNLLEQLEVSNAKAVKFKVGGRMSSSETPKGRSEKLIVLARKTLGDKMVISADSNGSYEVAEAIRIGRIMEENGYDFFEEPVPFDWYEETKIVADKLDIPIAGGEQEGSMRNFRWLIGNEAIQVLQADMFYFGGLIRSMKASRMAKVLNIPHTPHVSNIGYVYMLHFVSAIPNAGRFHEFKSPFNDFMEFECPTSSLLPENGVVNVPSGPGLGIEFSETFIKKHKILKG